MAAKKQLTVRRSARTATKQQDLPSVPATKTRSTPRTLTSKVVKSTTIKKPTAKTAAKNKPPPISPIKIEAVKPARNSPRKITVASPIKKAATSKEWGPPTKERQIRVLNYVYGAPDPAATKWDKTIFLSLLGEIFPEYPKADLVKIIAAKRRAGSRQYLNQPQTDDYFLESLLRALPPARRLEFLTDDKKLAEVPKKGLEVLRSRFDLKHDAVFLYDPRATEWIRPYSVDVEGEKSLERSKLDAWQKAWVRYLEEPPANHKLTPHLCEFYKQSAHRNEWRALLSE